MDLSLLEGSPYRDSRFCPVRSAEQRTSPPIDISSWDDGLHINYRQTDSLAFSSSHHHHPSLKQLSERANNSHIDLASWDNGLHIDYRYQRSWTSSASTRSLKQSIPDTSSTKRSTHTSTSRNETLISYNLVWLAESGVWLKQKAPSQSPRTLGSRNKGPHMSYEYYGKLEYPDWRSESEPTGFHGSFLNTEPPPTYESHALAQCNGGSQTWPQPLSLFAIVRRLRQLLKPKKRTS
jgi:hypothetical protein